MLISINFKCQLANPEGWSVHINTITNTLRDVFSDIHHRYVGKRGNIPKRRIGSEILLSHRYVDTAHLESCINANCIIFRVTSELRIGFLVHVTCHLPL